ncbi:MAG TPA: GFA family protein [Allosphingosinicella sp.]|nr:GFA family protein [Allosphingosinicella sp.]
MAETRLEGGCACRTVRYRLNSAPMFVHCCHCTSCQTETGGAFALNALIESDRVETLSGTPEPMMIPSESGLGQQVWRCPSCRVALWSNYGGAKDKLRFVRVGTLDDPAALPPDIHIYTRSKLPWVRLPEGALAVDAYYDSRQVWPPESLARRAELFG